MGAKLMQICDGCGKARELKVSDSGRNRDNMEAATSEGWYIVGINLHLCPDCIKRATSQEKHSL